MKKLLTLLLLIFFFNANSDAQYITIPDANFRNYLKDRYPLCFNAADEMDTTCSSINAVTTFRVPDNSVVLRNIDGIQYFKSVDSLIMINLNIDTIMAFPPAVQYVDLTFNSLSSPVFPVIPGTVKHCNFGGMNRSELPALPNSVTYLNLDYSNINSITQLPLNLEYFTALPSNIYYIDSFPGNIKTIIIDGWRLGGSLPALPSSLNYFQTKGISRLPALPDNLEALICIDSLQQMPVLPQNLRHLDWQGIGLYTTLPVLPDSLRYINLANNNFYGQLTTLPPQLEYFSTHWNYSLGGTFPAMPNTLRHLDVQYNRFTGFTNVADSLKYFDFYYNLVSQIPALPDGLDTLICAGNPYSSLPSTLPGHLKELICSSPALTSLPPLPDGLLTLSCGGTQMTSLPALPKGLRFLGVNNNRRLTNLPELPDSLRSLDCSKCAVRVLPALPKPLILLNCDHNPIDYLPALPDSMAQIIIDSTDIQCLPKIPKSAPFNARDYPGNLYIQLDESKVKCIPNLPERVYINYYNRLPICNPVNNSNHCSSFPVVSGNVFIDNNNNGIKDANEYYKGHVKMELSNGNTAYTNNNGYFEIAADSTGTYTLTATAPDYYNILPASATYNFTTYDTIVSKSYALQPNTVKDSLAIKLIPLNWAARPGFAFPYWINFENAGTSTLSPTIIFDYDNTKLIYDSTSNAAVVNNGNHLSLTAGTLVPGQQQGFTAYFKVKPSAVIGDVILSKATINSNNVTAADSSSVFVRGAYDPNDKEATAELSPLQIANGAYINYTIRFQNTGNDTAFNVVISDTLAAELLLNTLQVTASSHNCKVTVKDNVVFFEFLNILLPDLHLNEMKSHGFVSFKIKPHPSMPAGETIHNTAAIFFDYNAPVITNTAGTFIRPFTVVPTRLLSFSAVPQMDNTTALYWNTVNEINTHQFLIEQGSDGIRFNTITSVLAKRRVNNNYSANVIDVSNNIVYYRLKIVNNDGSFTYSPIIKIDGRKNTAGFSVVTNPVKDFIVINTTVGALNNSSCNIISSQGAVVKSFIIKEGSQTIDVKGLPAGIYYLRTTRGSTRIIIH